MGKWKKERRGGKWEKCLEKKVEGTQDAQLYLLPLCIIKNNLHAASAIVTGCQNQY